MLEARNLVLTFGGIRAVRDFSLALRDRALHALIGPNGAGKTTAFNLISGMYAPQSGTVDLAGRSIAGLPPEAVTQAGVGRSFQITNLFPTLSVAENVRLAVQARDRQRFAFWRSTASLGTSTTTRPKCCARWGWRASSARKRDRFPTAGSDCSTWRSHWARSRGCCCSTSRWPGSRRPSASAWAV